jgi:predicted amidophosphoribosyltransferase
VLKNVLVRQEKTAAQRSIEGRDRLSNLEGAFGPAAGKTPMEHYVRGKRVILLDDIFTTGATALHCGRILKEAGAASVDFLSIATGNDYADGFFGGETVSEETACKKNKNHVE